MNTPSLADDDRLLELLADRALFGLDDEGRTELEKLQPQHHDIADGEMDSIVALLEASRPDNGSAGIHTQLPASLSEKILHASKPDDHTQQKARLADRSAKPVDRATGRWSRRLVLIACTAAATLLAVSGLDALRNANTPVPPKALTLAEQREQLLAAAPDAVNVAWQDLDKTGAGGKVVWSDSKQTGFMTFKGLAINDPKLNQYQLWIFDKEQDEKFPIDGGVFDIAGDNVIVPIQAKINVSNATMFAITIEKPGGVVVSDRQRLPLIAKVEP